MENMLKLEQISNESRAAMITLLWGIINERDGSLSSIYKMVSGGDITALPEYIERVDSNRPHYNQGITVDNPYIDIVLNRYMLESVIKNIIVDCDVDSLADVSVEAAIRIVDVVKKGFAAILGVPSGSKVFLTIKVEKNNAIVSVDGNKELYRCEVAL